MTDSKLWWDRYNLIKPIGEGGMGCVYLAEDKHKDNRLCVVKQTKNSGKDLLEQAEVIKTFQREVALLSRLKHRSIVSFFDEHSSEDGLFLVMEYVPGANFERILQRENYLCPETVTRIAIQCCDVLEYLHSFEPPIIYRDLKPSNLILRPDGLVVFVDFGIARNFEPQNSATRIVTSGYSPPEQYVGKPGPRGDLYSLGATMHHMLTGVRPKPLTSCSPVSINPDVLVNLDALVRKLTAQNLEERPPSAKAVQYELFCVYKDIHPEFAVPYLGLEEETKTSPDPSKSSLIDKFKLWFDDFTH